VAIGDMAAISVTWPSLSIVLANTNLKISNTVDAKLATVVTNPQSLSADHNSSQLADPLENSSDIRFPPPVTSSTSEMGIAREGSYQTAPLDRYSSPRLALAEELFDLLSALVPRKARRYKGSYSILGSSSGETAAKIILYETGLGKTNGPLQLVDGVYVLVRANGCAGESIWKHDHKWLPQSLRARLNRAITIGVAPKHDERFYYFLITRDEDLQEIAAAFAVCSSA